MVLWVGEMNLKLGLKLFIPLAGVIISLLFFQNCGRIGGFSLKENLDSASLGSSGDPGPLIVPSTPVTPGPPAAPDADCMAESAPPVAPILRITKNEYNNVIRDLFGLTNDFSMSFNSDRYGSAGYSTESEAQSLSAAIVNDFWVASKAVADALFSKNPNPLFATCSSGDTCAKTIIKDLTTRAYRRPATQAELDKLFNLYKASSSTVFADAMKLVVRSVLMMPQFIFRVAEAPTNGATQVALNDYELASRLSFFIWGSIPDSELMNLAAQGTLKNPATLEAQARRLLKDPRAKYLTKTFGRQWLSMDSFDKVTMSTDRFPNWNASMKASMKNETEAFIDNVFYTDQSIMDFVGGNYSFLDSNVATLYGASVGSTSQFMKTTLDQTRFGILTHPSILSMNSYADHTSPVRRGKWTLERILCNPPGSPPADVPPLPPAPSGDDLRDESYIRQRLAQHRLQGATCNGCHSIMDPVGLSYENYNPMGSWRNTYINGQTVDASGMLPTGEKLRDFSDLAKIFQTDYRYPTCFTSNLMSFSQGVNMKKFTNRCTIALVRNAGTGNTKKFSDLVVIIVKSSSFRSRTVGN